MAISIWRTPCRLQFDTNGLKSRELLRGRDYEKHSIEQKPARLEHLRSSDRVLMYCQAAEQFDFRPLEEESGVQYYETVASSVQEIILLPDHLQSNSAKSTSCGKNCK